MSVECQFYPHGKFLFDPREWTTREILAADSDKEIWLLSNGKQWIQYQKSRRPDVRWYHFGVKRDEQKVDNPRMMELMNLGAEVWDKSSTARQITPQAAHELLRQHGIADTESMTIAEAAECLTVSISRVYALIVAEEIDCLSDSKLPLKSSVEAYKSKLQPGKKIGPTSQKAKTARARKKYRQNIERYTEQA